MSFRILIIMQNERTCVHSLFMIEDILLVEKAANTIIVRVSSLYRKLTGNRPEIPKMSGVSRISGKRSFELLSNGQMIKMKNLPFAFDEGKCANVGDDSVMLCGKTKSCHLFDGDNFHKAASFKEGRFRNYFDSDARWSNSDRLLRIKRS